MKEFGNLKKEELMEVNGGFSWELAGVLIGAYLGLREVVRDAGARLAYEELGR